MNSSASSTEQRCYISESWANRESPQAKVNAQGYSIARAKKVHQASIHLTDKFTTLTQMVLDLQKIGRKL
jgi:hypothetical protein